MASNFPSGEMTPRMQLERQYTTARFDLLVLIAFTVINLLMLVSQNFTYFLFSVNLPYLLVDLGMYFGGVYANVDPALMEAGYGILGEGFFYAMLAVAILIVCVYFVCWLLSANGKVGWLVAALSLFAIDTLLMLGMIAIGLSEPSIDFFIDVAFHAYVLYALAQGLRAHCALKKLDASDVAPAEEPVPTTEDAIA